MLIRKLLVLGMLGSFAPASAGQMAGPNEDSGCPYERARAAAVTGNAQPAVNEGAVSLFNASRSAPALIP
ncbi:MAG: hypothetical protein ACJ8D5_08550 [Sphingomicrobium sp.]